MTIRNRKAGEMRERAIEILRSNGVRFAPHLRQIENVIAEIERFTGLKRTGDAEAFVERFVRGHAQITRTPEPVRRTSEHYRYSDRMKMNLQRSRGFNPISMTSRVRE